uniref:Uncharacterized protein n=1 Tax=Marseillevirus LCMAC201 TaxID=2506605 RepID=A0A481YWX6_9VIRU|nr:MAG: hypothetical protein LCMAC201_03010 [Marseillevirus LCMAC201]
MYKYTFTLDSGKKDHLVGNMFQNALLNYFQWRGIDILGGENLNQIDIYGYPKGGESYNVNKDLVTEIVSSFKKHNTLQLSSKVPSPKSSPVQQERCQEMKKKCPAGSNKVDPIMYDDWCDDIPYREFVKHDEYLSQCYRLTNLINAFNSRLMQKKGINYFPQWPIDPFTRIPLSVKKIYELYQQAQDAKIDIPIQFEQFVEGLRDDKFNVNVAMKGPYIGNKINPQYIKEFVIPVVSLLFQSKQSTQTQEEQDLQMALQLAGEFSSQY